ncbi:MAG TPA: Nif3-like dinuclear metal center hexameric protein [Kofleriaceae bacterium]|nr:Nif3-like dinuclear metal center hexameric protein [Kofleriaceae bacterium]
MTVRLDDVVSFLDTTLEIERFRDYGPNGLQVEGRSEVRRVVAGVSANAALFERAAKIGADLIVVHHGLIWGGGLARVTGAVARRLELLLRHGMSLAAYHLPLDAHPRLGNNVGLADAIGLGEKREAFGEVRGHSLGVAGSWAQPMARADALARISATVCGGAELQFVFPHGPERVRRIGLCTGAASDLLEAAAAAGCDLFLTGELSERAGELSRELGITLCAAGHYNTEVFGPRRLCDELSRQFPHLSAQLVAVPSPL